MYAKLKQIMQSKGYTVSLGDGWTASDTEQFTSFAKFVLGAPGISVNQVLAYPEAFPSVVAAIDVVHGGGAEPVATAAAPVAPIPEPVAAPVDEPVAEEAPASTVFDASGSSGDTPEAPQVLEQPEQPAAEEAPVVEDAAEEAATEEVEEPTTEEAPVADEEA